MGGLVLVSGVVWLGILTFVVLMLVRQAVMITAQIAVSPSGPPGGDGPRIGAVLDPVLVDQLVADPMGRQFVLMTSSTCTPCHEFLEDLGGWVAPLPGAVLLTGPISTADSMAARLRWPAVEIKRDPVASELAVGLGISATPYAIVLQDGRVVGKGYVRDRETFARLLDFGDDVSLAASAHDPLLKGV